MQDDKQQRTLAGPAVFSGIGLHTGSVTSMTCRPAPPDTGIVMRRVDLPGMPDIPATIANVKEALRGTTLAVGETRVHTVEHLMSALYGMGIDNAFIDLDGEEPPAMDGSALPFVETFIRTGVTVQAAERSFCELSEVLWLEDGDRSLVYRPSPRFEVTFTLEYPDNIVARQTFHAVINEEFFKNRLCQARTFGFTYEFDMLKERHLALGGSLENAVVIRDDGSLMNETGLRDPSEFVLHKILDLVGDFALIGRRLRGHILAHKTGHAYNIKFARRLCAHFHQHQERKQSTMMNIEDIKTILPHRYPFLLVDKILSIDPGKSAIGIKNVTANEPFFQGHFPARAVMPGVLIVEAMAQVAGVLFLSQPEHKGKLPFFCGIDKVRFRRPVTPGDRLEFKVEALKVRGNTGKVAVEARVDGELASAGELMFTIV